MTNTRGQTLAELAYPGNLREYVAARRQAGDSWRAIRDQVNANLNAGVTVTHVSLMAWYGQVAA